MIIAETVSFFGKQVWKTLQKKIISIKFILICSTAFNKMILKIFFSFEKKMRFGNPSKRMRRKLYGYLKNTPLKKDTKKEEEYNPLKITAISIISFSNATTRHYLAEKLFQSCGYCMRTPNSNSTFIIGAPANKKGEMYDMALDYLSK